MSRGDREAPGSLADLAARIRSRQQSVSEVVERAFDRIRAVDGDLNACSVVLFERALAQAAGLDRELARGRSRGPLHGAPIVVKDNFDIAGVPTTAGSPLLPKTPAAATAAAVVAFERAGAVVVAKTNMYELAYGAANPAFGPVRNPWGADRATGGSSSGAAVAVAAGLAYGALGTDSGGSIRIPAGYCGVVGFKPTLGSLPTDGTVPVSRTLDHVGPIGRTVDDVVAMMEAVVPAFGRPGAARGVRVGVASARLDAFISPRVADALAEAARTLRGSGALVSTIALPALDRARTVKWTISAVEAADTHRDLLANARESIQPAVRELLEQGERVTPAAYRDALRERAALQAEFAALFADLDAIVMPALPAGAPPRDAATIQVGGASEPALLAMTKYMSLFNVTGSPAVVVPCGLDEDGMPLSLQVAAATGEDLTALSIARTVQRSLERSPTQLSGA